MRNADQGGMGEVLGVLAGGEVVAGATLITRQALPRPAGTASVSTELERNLSSAVSPVGCTERDQDAIHRWYCPALWECAASQVSGAFSHGR